MEKYFRVTRPLFLTERQEERQAGQATLVWNGVARLTPDGKMINDVRTAAERLCVHNILVFGQQLWICHRHHHLRLKQQFLATNVFIIVVIVLHGS